MNYSFEAELGKALDRMLQEEIDEIMKSELPEHIFSRRHERRMNKLFKEDVHTSFGVKKVARILVAALLSILLGIGVAASVSKEFRSILKDTVIKITDSITAYIKHGETMSSFSVNENHNPADTYITKTTKTYDEPQVKGEDIQTTGTKKWEISYLPIGYTTVYEWFFGEDMGSVSYENIEMKEMPIHFDYSPIDSSISFNNEGVYFESFEENGVVYTLVISYDDSNRSNMIFWAKEQTVFTITSKIEIEELKKIAFSVKNVK